MLSGLLSDLRLFFLLLFIGILVTLIDSFGVLNFPKSLIQRVTVPIQYGLYQTSRVFISQFNFIVLARRASQENKALTEQLAQVLSENSNLRRQLAEARGFLTQQQALDPKTYNLVPVRPLGLNRYLKIDKGGDDGIKVGMAIVYKDSYLGKIEEVSPKSSLVILSSDPDSKIASFVSNQKGKAKGILLGQFGSDMLMDKILHQENVSVGDLVYSEGTEGDLPRGLVLGRVSQIMDRPNEIFKQAKVKSVFDIGDLDIVFVITS